VADTWHLIGIHAYYSPAPSGPGSPGLIHSTSTDLISWQDQGAAIPVGPAGTWDSYDVWAPTLIKQDSTYHLWYAGVKLVGNRWIQKIGHATSADLSTWNKDAGNPVIDCATIPWVYWSETDPAGFSTECRDPFVTWDAAQNQWVMFYTTRSKTISQDPIRWIENPPIVGMATSSDLVNWVDGGPVVTTGGYQAESPHAFEHNGTWWLVWTGNCSWRSSKCLKYATSSALTGPYTGYSDVPAVGGDEYASEYYQTSTGAEYFARVGNLGGWLDIDTLTWPNNTFTLSNTPAGSVTGRVWQDTNRNGQVDAGETGVNDLTIQVYIDDGDNTFDPLVDTLLDTANSYNSGSVQQPINGSYRMPWFSFSRELPWRVLWLRADPDALDYSTPALTGYVPTTPTVLRFDNTAGGGVVSAMNFGFAPNDTNAPSAVQDLTVR
jgi:hypothetical protein